ncbi:MAG TPA: glycosyltransferase family 4 protein [Solirubrobacteraceae bacterium]|nr:glycosyltransferase family 4 protein [Solirubrobacteraceae bacterium]
MAPLVWLACPGLDHARRGFETFARECFEALRNRDDLRIELVKGSGPSAPQERSIPTLLRDSAVARALARGRLREPFVVEHLSYAASLLPRLVQRPPDVVYFSEWHLGRVLGAWRRRVGGRFRLVLCNGGAVAQGYGHLDLVQQFMPGARDYAVALGEPAERQVVLPLGVVLPPFKPLGEHERRALRARLGLPTERRVVISVAALNDSHKRIGYLIEEIARMPAPRPYLLLIGHAERETPPLRALAAQRLGSDGHDIRSVAPAAVGEQLRAADAFVLTSLWESFGRVLVEALGHGLPVLAHEHPVMRWVLGDEGDVADLRQPRAVAEWLGGARSHDRSEPAQRRRHEAAYERFSWDTLAPRYAEMLRSVAPET